MSKSFKNSDGSIPLFIAILLWFLSLFILVCGASWAWLIKDGLGPDRVESEGFLAWYRFWLGFQETFAFAVIPTFVLGAVCFWCDLRAHRAQFEETGAFPPV